MHVVTVTFKIAPGHFDSFLPAVRQQRLASLARSVGCRTFDVAHDGTGAVFLYELYDAAEDFARHLQTEHFKTFAAATAHMVIAKEVGQWRLDVEPKVGANG